MQTGQAERSAQPEQPMQPAQPEPSGQPGQAEQNAKSTQENPLRLEPSLEEVHAIAQQQKCRRIPVKRELYADFITPIEAMRALRAASNHCFMLESAEADESWGRYTFLGFNPSLEITCSNGTLRTRYNIEGGTPVVQTYEVTHPGNAIRAVIEENKSATLEGFPPFTGGLVGYFSYDYIKYAEPTLRNDTLSDVGSADSGAGSANSADSGAGDFLDVDLMAFDKVIAFDGYRQKIVLVAGVHTNDIDASYEQAARELDRIEDILCNGEREPFAPLYLQEELTPRYSKERYRDMVETARKHIFEGDIFQVVLSNPMTAAAEGSLFDTYRVLRCTNPSPYMFYFTSDDVEIAGASPETLVRLRDGVLYTYPLAGTRPRGATPEEDAALEEELLQDEKELSEHNMLVDLGRNDLGRISEIGSVEVETFRGVLRFSRVMHIGSTVAGRIAKGKDAVDAVDAVLPAGTLSGAPKLRACEIIAELENTPRGIYGGAIGYLDFTGNLDTCISIRLAYKKNGVVCVQSGAGIVADSVGETEFLECRNKARAVTEAIAHAQGGLDSCQPHTKKEVTNRDLSAEKEVLNDGHDHAQGKGGLS